MNAGEWDWYKVANLTVQSLASVATVAMAWIAGCELRTARVARKEVDALNQSAKAIAGDVEKLQRDAMVRYHDLTNAMSQVNLFGDMIAAAGGYRVAYLRVLDKLLSPENIPDMSSYQAEHLLDSINIFAEHPASNQVIRTIMYENAIITNTTELLTYLNAPNRDARLYAINSIYILRLNKLIPNVAKLVAEDKDMNVVQYALYVVVETLRNNIQDPNVCDDEELCSFNFAVESPSKFSIKFNTLWKQYGETIKARLPRELKHIASKDHPDSYYVFLYNPERKENIPLPEKDDDFWFKTPTHPQLR